MTTSEETLEATIKRWKEYCNSLLREIEQLKEELRKYRGY